MRPQCPQCDFLKSRCLCDSLTSINNRLHLIVLSHPSELKHPLSTVRIMKKSFNKITVIVGEDFSLNPVLNTLLQETGTHFALLFPTQEAHFLNEHSLENFKNISHIILIDGTWRKAKKIFALSHNLHKLPAIKLIPLQKTNYRIRKPPSVNALSTLEASVEVLHYLEAELDTSSLTKSFLKMIDLQIECIGEEVYQNNYLNKKGAR